LDTGHAWVAVGLGAKYGSIGFWPDASVCGILFGSTVGSPGVLKVPDPHDGQEEHVEKASITYAGLKAFLEVVNQYDEANYSLVYKNCAMFAADCWKAATGQAVLPGDSGPRIWVPAGLGNDIDDANKVLGLDATGKPLPGTAFPSAATVTAASVPGGPSQ
jgi:hypothetical protein